MARVAAEVFHPSVFIREEMEARNWTQWILAVRMSETGDAGDVYLTYAALDFYLTIGAANPGLRIDEVTAAGLARAFGTSVDYWLNLEKQWLEAQGEREESGT